jgi:hypothetical protein
MDLENRTLAVIVSQSANAKAAPMALEDIPEWVRGDAEDAYAQCKNHPQARLHAEFDSVEDAKLYMRMLSAYCQNRPDGKGGVAPIRFRKSPTRNQPDHIIDFRVTDLLTENEKQTEDIRTAVKAVKAAAAPAPMASTTVKATPSTMPAKKAVGRPAKAR